MGGSTRGKQRGKGGPLRAVRRSRPGPWRPVRRGLPAVLSLLLALSACSRGFGGPAPSTAPPACVEDPVADAAARGLASRFGEPLQRSQLTDLNSDGEEETLVASPDDCGASGNCPYRLYLSGACSTYAGEVAGVDFEVFPASQAGHHDLWAFWRGGCAGAAGTATLFRYDGAEYRVASRASCPCPLDETVPVPAPCALRFEGEPAAVEAAAAWFEAHPAPEAGR